MELLYELRQKIPMELLHELRQTMELLHELRQRFCRSRRQPPDSVEVGSLPVERPTTFIHY
jgi:hypothetical protein